MKKLKKQKLGFRNPENTQVSQSWAEISPKEIEVSFKS